MILDWCTQYFLNASNQLLLCMHDGTGSSGMYLNVCIKHVKFEMQVIIKMFYKTFFNKISVQYKQYSYPTTTELERC